MSSMISGEATYQSGLAASVRARIHGESTPTSDVLDLDSMPTLDGLPLYQLSIAQYEWMADAGILDERSQVVLINGLLVAKVPINPPHRIASDNLTLHLIRRLPDGWHVSVANPLLLPESGSVPEPDLKIVRGRSDDYRSAHPKGTDLALVIEISDSTLRADETRMKRIYAEGSIPHYWIVNLRSWRIEVYSDPTGPAPEPEYRRVAYFVLGDEVPIILGGVEALRLAVTDILPRERYV